MTDRGQIQKSQIPKPSAVKRPDNGGVQSAGEPQRTYAPYAPDRNNTSETPIDVPTLKPTHIIQLQRSIGNQATQRLLKVQNNPPPIQRGVIFDFFSDVWEFLTGSSETETSSKPKSTPKSSASKPEPVNDATIYTVTDPVAYVRTPPPALHSTGDWIPVGGQVTIFERATKNGKQYVNVVQSMPEGSEGPPRTWGWTWRGNLSGGTHEPTEPEVVDPEDPEIDDPDTPVTPSSGDNPGLPSKPAISHESFTSIVADLERMEQNPVPTGAVREESGDEREQRVSDIDSIRDQIAALSAAELGISEKELKQAKAYLYRRLAPLAPYFGQFGNANILESKGGKKAWKRTCNVTVPAMVLEGLGKSLNDYTGDVELLRRIFGALEDKYLVRDKQVSKDPLTDFDSLRLADYLQLAAIARKLKADDTGKEGVEFEEAVEKARLKAAAATIAHATITSLLEEFGATPKQGYVHQGTLETIGSARRAHVWNELQKATTGSYGKKTAEEREAAKTAYESVNANEMLAVETYRASVLKKVKPPFDGGAQILVGMESHFVRLDAVDDEHIQVDDPGRKNFKNLTVTWEQARDLGYFKTFWTVT